MRNIITKKELTEIQRYWNHAGGFGGELNSDICYHSETGYFGRVGVLELEKDGGNLDFDFYKDDTIADIKERLKKIDIDFKVKTWSEKNSLNAEEKKLYKLF